MILQRALHFASELVRSVVQPGDGVIDATVGNGYDTCLLAERVGPQGQVWGFDIQQKALDRTRARLQQEDLIDRVILVHESHEHMDRFVPDPYHGRIRAIMFNLGYLPGGEHRCITRPETTLLALNAGLDLLAHGGVMTIVLYAGHEGGVEERDAVTAWARALDQSRVHVLEYRFINQRNHPPMLLALEIVGDRP